MKRTIQFLMAVLLTLGLTACGSGDLVDMTASEIDGRWTIQWEGRTYTPFCVVSKGDRGEQVGYVNGDKDDRVSTYKEYPAEEWLVCWLPMDGGAMLYKEEGVEDVPEGLEREYE